MKYADVILPLPLENSYTYRIPEDLERAVTPGCRVIVHFGKKRYYTAIVMEVHDRNRYPILRRRRSTLCWMPRRCSAVRNSVSGNGYLLIIYVSWVDVYKAPSFRLKVGSETAVTYNEDFEATAPLAPRTSKRYWMLFSGGFEIDDLGVEKKTGLRNVVPIVSSLMVKGAVEVSEELKRGFVPKTQAFIRLAEAYR